MHVFLAGNGITQRLGWPQVMMSCHGFQGRAQGAVELFRADHADLFDRSDVTGDDAVGDEAEVVVHVTQTCGVTSSP